MASRSITIVLIIIAIASLIAPIGTQARSIAPIHANEEFCQQGRTVTCGPNCSSYYDIVWNGHFSQTGCSAWQFMAGAQRASSGTLCGTPSAPLGKFTGPINGWSGIYQTIFGQQSGPGNFSFTYEYEINDPLNDPNTHVEV